MVEINILGENIMSNAKYIWLVIFIFLLFCADYYKQENIRDYWYQIHLIESPEAMDSNQRIRTIERELKALRVDMDTLLNRIPAK